VNGRVIFALLGIPGKPRDPGHRPHHHSPYAQNALICLPKTKIAIDYRRRKNGGYTRILPHAPGYRK
jgi:ribosomal protein L17